jgi:uncharacterized paraquat-inducible protein A
MAIAFNCPDCGCLLHAAYDAAGQKIYCDDCGQATRVPWAKSVVVYVGQLFANGFAVAPIFLGLFAIFFAWVPLIGIVLSIPLGLLGICLAAVGFLVNGSRNRRALRQSIVGAVMCALAIVGTVVSTRTTLNYLRSADKSPSARQPPHPQTATPPGHPPRVMTIDGQPANARP